MRLLLPSVALLLLASLPSPAQVQDFSVSDPKGSKAEDPLEAARERLASSDMGIRRQAVAEISRSRQSRVIPWLIPLLQDKEPILRQETANSLGILRAIQAAPDLRKLLLKDKETQVRQSAAIALTYLNDPGSQDALIKALKDDHSGVRYAAARALGSMRSAKAVKPLLKALKSKDAGMRRSAAGALGMIQSKDALEALVEALEDSDTYTRLEAAKAIGNLRDNSASVKLRPLLKEPDPSFRIQIALSLARLQDPYGLQAARELLENKDTITRQRAASIIGMAGVKKDLKLLQDAAKKEKKGPARNFFKMYINQLRARLGVPEPPPKKKSRSKRKRSR